MPTAPDLFPTHCTNALSIAIMLSQGLDRLDAQLLLLHAMHHAPHDRAWLLAHDTDRVDATTLLRLTPLVQRRVRGEPLAYITGHKEFFGLNLAVDARVLVPRPDTEVLVEWALTLIDAQSCTSVLDLGTGSGAIALALKSQRPNLNIHAIDTSADALDVARANATRLQLPVQFHQGHWCTALQDTTLRFDIIASNPPYIATHDAHLEALQHEPTLALTSGIDGLDAIRHLVGTASAYLTPGGWLLLEHGFDQAKRVQDLMCAAGFVQVQSRQDLAGLARCTGGQRASSRE
jgi:release factor glutamine methyltransferase